MKTLTLAAALAARLQPVVEPGAFDPPTACLYQVLPASEGRVRIAYWFSWTDETHPAPLVDLPYRLIRWVRYGGVADLEYVVVEADAETGRPLRLAFESPGHRPESLDAFPLRGGRPVLVVASWNHLFRPGGATPATPRVPLVPLTDELSARLRLDRRSRVP